MCRLPAFFTKDQCVCVQVPKTPIRSTPGDTPATAAVVPGALTGPSPARANADKSELAVLKELIEAGRIVPGKGMVYVENSSTFRKFGATVRPDGSMLYVGELDKGGLAASVGGGGDCGVALESDKPLSDLVTRAYAGVDKKQILHKGNGRRNAR